MEWEAFIDSQIERRSLIHKFIPGVWMLVERFPNECGKPNTKAITTGAKWTNRLPVPCSKREAGFGFACHSWKTGVRVFAKPVTKHNNRYRVITFDSRFKTALSTKAFVLFLASTSHMATGVTQGKLFPNRHTTFLTVSDVPMQLSRHLQLAQQMNQNTSESSRKSPPNVEQYHYDFTLERGVLRAIDSV